MKHLKVGLYPEIISVWEKVNDEGLELTQKLKGNKLVAYEYFVETLNDLSAIFKLIDEKNMVRQNLIEAHCLNKPIELKRHEEYHDISNKLLSDIRTFFLLYKTCLNSLTLLLKNIIPETKVKGLRFRSFGSLVKSSIRIHFEDSHYDEFRQIIKTRGMPIEDDILSYRDKYIEHPRNPIRGNISTTNTISKILHIIKKGIRDDLNSNNAINPTKDSIVCRVDLKVESKGMYYYYHIQPTVKTKECIASNKPLGYTYDNTGIHFQRYGSHGHLFGPPGESFNVEEIIYNFDEIRYSPSPDESLLKLYELVTEMFSWLNKNITIIS